MESSWKDSSVGRSCEVVSVNRLAKLFSSVAVAESFLSVGVAESLVSVAKLFSSVGHAGSVLSFFLPSVGFARAFTDGVSLVYLADVYVLPEYRGRGLGVELIREIVDNGPYADIRWVLHTRDAFGLYDKFGFGEPSPRLMERYRRDA